MAPPPPPPLLLLFLLLLLGGIGASGALHEGSWLVPPAALPNTQLPHVPLAGNGHLGVALDAQRAARNTSASGAGDGNTVDAWVSTTGMWSCTSCGQVDPDGEAQACCSTIALGGASVRLTPTFPASAPLPGFYASQTAETGLLTMSFGTPHGGSINTTTRVHPTRDLLAVNVSYAPQAGDPPLLALTLSMWVLGNGAIPGSWNTGVPAIWSVRSPSYEKKKK